MNQEETLIFDKDTPIHLVQDRLMRYYKQGYMLAGIEEKGLEIVYTLKLGKKG